MKSMWAANDDTGHLRREGSTRQSPRLAAIVLAAGLGTRFDPGQTETKITSDYRGLPLIRRVVEAALGSRAQAVIVVTGHAHDRVETALHGLPVRFAQNADYASGLASSIRIGIAALDRSIDGAVMMLGDMPLVTTETLDMLIERLAAEAGKIAAVVPTFNGKHGNPVLFDKVMFARMATLQGDEGARRILRSNALSVGYCEVPDRGVLIDVDTRTDLAALAGWSHRA